MEKYFRRHIALPTDHGSWVFLLSPLLIGLAAGKSWNNALILLVLAALSAFLLRQPVTIVVKIFTGRRSRHDLTPAILWIAVYGSILIVTISGLILMGYATVLILALPAAPIFLWHLYLVSKRSERKQVGVEILGSGVLALSAPAAYWIGAGTYDFNGWWLFILTWLQSAASIVYAYLRLEQRQLDAIPVLSIRIKMSRKALLFTTFNFLVVGLFSIFAKLPILLPVPYGLQLIETIWGSSHPAVGWKPAKIGIRQLIVSVLFTLLFIMTWNVE